MRMDIPSIVIKGVQSLEERKMYLAESSYKSINPKDTGVVWQIPTKTVVTLCISHMFSGVPRRKASRD